MSRIQEVFKAKKEKVINLYCTAGYPKLDDTLDVMRCLQEAGVDIIELGMPYSDPLADGPVIQESSALALKNGMTIPVLFRQLENFRKEISVPVILMGYLNPIMQYGFEKFCEKAAAIGIDGLIVPDIPLHEFERQYRSTLQKYQLDFIFLITPETSEERIRKIDELSSGFLYAVSSSSITGAGKDLSGVEGYLQRLQQMNLKNPVLVGFGIHDKESFVRVCRHSNGAIIGSAYVKALAGAKDIKSTTHQFIQSIHKPGY